MAAFIFQDMFSALGLSVFFLLNVPTCLIKLLPCTLSQFIPLLLYYSKFIASLFNFNKRPLFFMTTVVCHFLLLLLLQLCLTCGRLA